MKKSDLPKTCVFKKIATSEHIFVDNGLVSNRHWILKTSWIESLPRTRYLNILHLKNKISKALVKSVTAKIKGDDYRHYDLTRVFNSIDIREYKPAPIGGIEYIKGYYKGDSMNFCEVAMTFKTSAAPMIDIEYSAILFFDASTVILIKDKESPVLLQSSSGEIIGMIAPLNPRTYNPMLKVR